MDVSKLPRLSTTNVPPPDPNLTPDPAPPTPPVLPNAAPNPSPFQRPGILEAYISIGVGLILLLVFPNTLMYLSSKVFHTHFGLWGPYVGATSTAKVDYILYTDGSKTFYRDLPLFWSDLVIFAFALVLIVDGILMVRFRQLPVLVMALSLTVVATLGNLIYLVWTFGNGVAIMSALAVLFGGYIAITQWSAISQLLRQRQAPTQ